MFFSGEWGTSLSSCMGCLFRLEFELEFELLPCSELDVRCSIMRSKGISSILSIHYNIIPHTWTAHHFPR
jgi:hypothetical protein